MEFIIGYIVVGTMLMRGFIWVWEAASSEK